MCIFLIGKIHQFINFINELPRSVRRRRAQSDGWCTYTCISSNVMMMMMMMMMMIIIDYYFYLLLLLLLLLLREKQC